MKYATIDLISFDEVNNLEKLNGLQIGVGYGAGIDVHIMQSYTVEHGTINIFDKIKEGLEFIFKKGDIHHV